MSQPTVNGTFDTYLGWTYYWTGWKPLPDANWFAGQWIAHKPGLHFDLYASWPGKEGTFWQGEHLNLTLQEGQYPITALTSSEECQAAMENARLRLADLINKEEKTQEALNAV